MGIREVETADIKSVAAIIRAANIPVAEQFNLNCSNAPSHPSFCTPEWIRTGMDRGERYFVRETAGEAAGCVAYDSPGPGPAYLNRLAVLPRFQNRGMGRQLVDHVIRLARADGKTEISIGIIKNHLKLKDWYTSLGFETAGSKRFRHLPFDVQFMRYQVISARNEQ